MTETTEFLPRIGALVRDARQQSGLTQAQLATTLGTSQSAINRIEKGQQNLTLEMISRIGRALDSEIVGMGTSGPSHLRVHGETTLSGAIDVKLLVKNASAEGLEKTEDFKKRMEFIQDRELHNAYFRKHVVDAAGTNVVGPTVTADDPHRPA